MSNSTYCRDRARECLDLAQSGAAEKALWLRWAMHWRRLAELSERGERPIALPERSAAIAPIAAVVADEQAAAARRA